MSLQNKTIKVYVVDIIDGRLRHSIAMTEVPTFDNVYYVLCCQMHAGLEVDPFLRTLVDLTENLKVGGSVYTPHGGHVTVKPPLQVWLNR